MLLFAIICLVFGILLGLLISSGGVTGDVGAYLAVACLAGLDTVFGGLRSNLEKRFDTAVLLTGFFSNIVIAFFLSWLGDRIGANIFLVCAFIFGQRIFINLSVIRRLLLQKWQDSRTIKQQAQQAEALAQPQELR